MPSTAPTAVPTGPVYFPGATSAPSPARGKGSKEVSAVQLLAISPPSPSSSASKSKSSGGAGGGPNLFLLTLTGFETDDNRLTAHLLHAYLEALQYVEHLWNSVLDQQHGAALITSGPTDLPLPHASSSSREHALNVGKSSKFFSNGLDFESAISDPDFFDHALNPVYEKLLTFPIPTVASIGGHCFAAGWGLAAAHDYRVMNGRKGFLCMNE